MNKPRSTHPTQYALSALLATLLMVFCPLAGHAEDDLPAARKIWMTGYQAMTQADKAMEDKSELAALHGYEKALEIFQKVQRDFPKWNVSLIKFRVEYCRQQIENIKASNAQNLAFMSKDDLVAMLNRQADDLQTFREQVNGLTRDLQNARNSLETARAEAAQAASSQENIRLLRNDRETLTAQVRMLTAQLETLKSELQDSRRTGASTQNADELAKQLAAARNELTAAVTQLEQLRKEKQKTDAQLEREASRSKNLATQLEAAQKNAATAQRTALEQKDELEQLRLDSVRFRDELSKQDFPGSSDITQLQARLRSREDELRSAQMEVLTLKRKLTQAEDNISDMGAKIETLDLREKTASDTASAKISEAETLREQNRRLEEQCTEQLNTIKTQKELLMKLEQAASEYDRQIQELRQANVDATGRLTEQGRQLDQSQQSLAQSRKMQGAAIGIAANAATMEEELEHYKSDIQTLGEKLKTAEGQLATQTTWKEELQRHLELYRKDQQEIVRLLGEKLKLENDLAEAKRDAANLQKLHDALKESIADANVRKSKELEAELSVVSEKLHELEQKEPVAAELKAAQERLAKLAAESAGISEQMREALKRNTNETEKLWSRRVQETEAQLSAETKKRQDLEAALVRRDSEKRNLEQELLRRGNGADALASNSDGASNAPAAAASQMSQQARLSITDEIIMKGYLRQGVDAERNGNIETAQWNYEQALKMQKDNLIALKRLGLIAVNRGDDSGAATYLNQAFRLAPDDHEVLLGLGFAMVQLNQPLWALAGLARAAALKPDDAEVSRLFGIALSTMNWQEAAEVQFQKTLKLKPDDAEAAFNLAMLELTRASELQRQAREDQKSRGALEALAAAKRADGLKWYLQAVQNGAQEDPNLEKALRQ